MSDAPAGEVRGDPEQCRMWSRMMRRAMQCYDLKPLERALLHEMILDSFDDNFVRKRVNLLAWAEALNLRDAKSLRPDWLWDSRQLQRKRERKRSGLLFTLVQLGMVDVDRVELVYEMRPHPSSWSIARTYRKDSDRSNVEAELKLSAERSLSVTLTSVSRERALAEAVPPGDCLGFFIKRLKDALQQNATEGELAALSEEMAKAFSGKFPETKPAPAAVSGNFPESGRRPGPASGKPSQIKIQMAAAALRWIESVDKQGSLQMPWVREQWEELSARDPDYVLRKLRGAIELRERQVRDREINQHTKRPFEALKNNLAYLSFLARAERKLSVTQARPGHFDLTPGQSESGKFPETKPL